VRAAPIERNGKPLGRDIHVLGVIAVGRWYALGRLGRAELSAGDDELSAHSALAIFRDLECRGVYVRARAPYARVLLSDRRSGRSAASSAACRRRSATGADHRTLGSGGTFFEMRHATARAFKCAYVGQFAETLRSSNQSHVLSAAWAQRQLGPRAFHIHDEARFGATLARLPLTSFAS
jgi:hypothetical protein